MRRSWALALLVMAFGCCSTAALARDDLFARDKRDIAMQLVSSAENSTTNWRAQYGYIEDIGDDRGYTAGLIGFTSATGDMVDLIEYYSKISPRNRLAKYLPALRKLTRDRSPSHDGLDPSFVADWRRASSDANFRKAQDKILNDQYFAPAVNRAKADGLSILGQFIYYDAIVMHGPGEDSNDEAFEGIRKNAMKRAKTPKQGGDETQYLNAFLDERVKIMHREKAHDDVSRVEKEQRRFLKEKNFDLRLPLHWETNEEQFSIVSKK